MSADTKPVREGEELPLAVLDAWLAEHVPSLHGALAIEQFPKGHSNLTYLVRKGDTELVLRRPPFAVQVKSGHDMAREHRVLAALAPVFAPAPRPIALCEDPAIIGAPFYLMERRRGRILRQRLPDDLRDDPALLRRVCEALVDGLVQLHAIDVAAVGLSDLGRPEGYAQRQVEGWIARYDKARTDDVRELEEVAAWLRERTPTSGEGTLVHNDYKLDNVMLDAADPTRIVAVLDWELCTLGDPLMDLGTTLGYWVQADDDPTWRALAFGPTSAPGAPTRREIADRYAEATGRDVSGIVFHYVFGLYKIAGIIQQIYWRFRHGHTTDPRFAMLDRIVLALARSASRAAGAERL
jgi:aminoglycoside phosphotransferase (APT) family kinase protein